MLGGMGPRVKYVTRGCLAGLVRAARAREYVHQVDPMVVKLIGDDDPPSAMVTHDIRNGILTAEVWTEADVRRGAKSVPRLLDIELRTYRRLPELDEEGRVVREVKPPERTTLIIEGRSGPIRVLMSDIEAVDQTFQNWEGAIVPVLEEFNVKYVRVSWMGRPKEGREIVLKLLPAGWKEAVAVVCHESVSATEAGRRCGEVLSERIGI